jgi:hypothetical protein
VPKRPFVLFSEGIVYTTDVNAGGAKVAGVTIPGRFECDRDLSDRGAQGGPQSKGGGGLRRLRDRFRGPEDARKLRLPEPVLSAFGRPPRISGQPFNPVLVVLAAACAAFFLLPLIGLVVRAPWASAAGALGDESSISALRLSLDGDQVTVFVKSNEVLIGK